MNQVYDLRRTLTQLRLGEESPGGGCIALPVGTPIEWADQPGVTLRGKVVRWNSKSGCINVRHDDGVFETILIGNVVGYEIP